MAEAAGAWLTRDLAETIADRHGTPIHALNLNRLRENYRTIRQAFEAAGLDMTVLYSVKTNYMPTVVDALREAGCGADVVSGPELELAMKLGFAPGDCVFNGPHKTDEELRTALSASVRINIDSVVEGTRLARMAVSAGIPVHAGLRCNPGIAVYRSDDPTFNLQAAVRAQESKFGFTIDDAAADKAIAAIGFGNGPLRLAGLHCHLGSQITDEDAFVAAVDRVFAFAARLRKEGHPIADINIGGGFGVSGIRRERRGPLRLMMALHGKDVLTGQRDGMDIGILARGVAEAAGTHGLDDLRFLCEPGRAIVSDAMAMIARVVSVKRSGGLDWMVLDAGLNLFPTISMAESHRIVSLSRRPSGAVRRFRIVGPLCYEGDVLAESRDLPADTAVGDLVSIEDSGAYTVSRSTNFIRPRAAVVSVSGGAAELCWRRETFDDIFAFHVPTQDCPRSILS